MKVRPPIGARGSQPMASPSFGAAWYYGKFVAFANAA